MKAQVLVKKKPAEVVADCGIKIVEARADYQEPLIVSVYGDPGSGKSKLIGTSPGDIALVPMERKSRQSVVKEAHKLGKNVLLPEIDLIRSEKAMLVATMPDSCITTADIVGNYKEEDKVKIAERMMSEKLRAIPLDGETPECCDRCYYRWHVNRVKSVAFRMAQIESVRTIAIDPFGAFCNDMLFANYGRNTRIIPLERTSFNQEVIDFLNAINHKNLILTHHMSQIWKDNKPTSKYKPMNAFNKIGHFTSVVIQMDRDEDIALGEGRYKLNVMDCQANAEIIGLPLLMDEMITFKNLAMQVYPDSDESNWD